ncbi:sulfatase-like hydrolase/transferase [Ruegeria sp. 2205SS24-7]|uniref:sulfatase-like hydrolase/transferase n=1 Tax=Ruegeria discodermiae TaxID=3064389 RepID=UPI002741F09A|nr:sulfatase-like hydrolase/transferase [Ruegeria sp. 2205SS24-7]MDP5220153.1 sulfatase-like hydrolase/transferase [Ruegeria sp. 2205SS24-7]
MRTIFLLVDSLNRHMLGPYGGDTVLTPNFDRLAARSATFNQHYVGSMPCMPARRDILTARMSFPHSSWGPIEPFDNTFTEILTEEKVVYSHLATDHFHYWENGGATYHNRYSGYDQVREQEGDRWNSVVDQDWDDLSQRFHQSQFATNRYDKPANMLNRERIRREEDFPSARTVECGLDFMRRNAENALDWSCFCRRNRGLRVRRGRADAAGHGSHRLPHGVFLETSYANVIIAAAIPSLLFYFGLFVQLDAYAARKGLKALQDDEAPKFSQVFREGWQYIIVLRF